MNIQKIFRTIPQFHNIVFDTILFESKYPLMFTCTQGNEVYLFICCSVSSSGIRWIGTKTSYQNLIDLLENRVTIRDAFLNISNEKITIDYNGRDVKYETKEKSLIDTILLPTEGEYMDAEVGEFDEELKTFRERISNNRYKIQFAPITVYRLNTIRLKIVIPKPYSEVQDILNFYDYRSSRVLLENISYC